MLGGAIGWPSAVRVQPEVALVVDAVSRPFYQPPFRAATVASATTTSPGGDALLVLTLAIWSSGCAVILLAWRVRWRRIAVAVRHAWPAEGGPELETLRAWSGSAESQGRCR